MPLPDRDEELLHLLDTYLKHLEQSLQVDPTSVEAFGSQDAAVQRWLQLAIQCCLDLGDLLLGRLGEPEPPRYRDIFTTLSRRGIVQPQMVRQMERLTDFRNALAHAYSGLTPMETWRQLRQAVPVLAEFAEIIRGQG